MSMENSERKDFDSGLAGFIAAETVLSHSDGARGILWVRGHTLPDLVERFGYDVSDGRAAVAAFQRRWRPRRIDGVIDGEIGALLFALLLDRDRGLTR